MNQAYVDHLGQFRDSRQGAAYLKKVSLFAKFSEEELASIYQAGDIVTLKPGANAVIEGEPTRGLYVLLDGQVSVYKTDPVTGSLSRLAMLSSGAIFGELSLVDTAPRSATVSAETFCYLFYLDTARFHKVLAGVGGDLALRFYQACAEDLAVRVRKINADYITAQQLLWKFALRRE